MNFKKTISSFTLAALIVSPFSSNIAAAETSDQNLDIVNNSTRNGNLSSAKAYTQVLEYGDKVGINYRFFYPYNGVITLGLGSHEGDWEGLQLIIDKNKNEIIDAKYSQHEGSEWNLSNAAIAPFAPIGDGEQYADGKNFSVDVNNNGQVVEVHESESGGELYVKTGSIKSNGTIEWNGARRYENGGKNPSAALLDDGTVIATHQSESSISPNLYSYVGKIEGTTVEWNDGDNSGDRYDSGKNTTIDVTNDGVVVETHENQSGGNLYIRTGQVVGGAINWNSSRKYDNGKRSSIAVNDDGDVVETHENESGGTLYKYTGRINNSGTKVNWDQGDFNGDRYDSGSNSSVTLANDGTIIEAHENQSTGKLYISKNFKDTTKISEQASAVKPNVSIGTDTKNFVLLKTDINSTDGQDMHSTAWTVLDRERPIMYSGINSHANYNYAGDITRDDAFGSALLPEETDLGRVWDISQNFELLSYETNNSLYHWSQQFEGKWGKSSNSPTFSPGKGWFKNNDHVNAPSSNDVIDLTTEDYESAADYAEEFAPSVFLHRNDDYRPSSIDWFLNQVELWEGSTKLLNAGEVNRWSLVGEDVNVSLSVDTFNHSNNTTSEKTGETYNGKAVVEVKANGANTTDYVNQTIYINPNGNTYTFGVWLKTSDGSPSQSVTLRMRSQGNNDGGNGDNDYATTFDITNEWEYYTVSHSFSTSADWLRTTIYPAGFQEGQGSILTAGADIQQVIQ
ncbi:hypothetical protein WAK64_04570 [Bacillus spongiae]|uniref:CBM-cenC domain-containing protein n=1 Tax=Bacillus spongiae TaxID=2683610 RepID=A0ABU8HAU0_9BACI